MMAPDRRTVRVPPVVVSCAVRYALGRSSYMPGLIADVVRGTWAGLDGQQAVIRKDIAREVTNGPPASAFDRAAWETWRDLLAWIDRQLPHTEGGSH